MAELSGFWTTTGAPAGHQQVSYTQAHWSIAGEIIAGCANHEGVAAGYMEELAATYISAQHCHVARGGAMVDGKWYQNDAVAGITIPSAGAGTVRYDRIILRCTWADFHVELAVLTGSAVAPTAPTQTTGTVYEILLYLAVVTDAGVVTLTDERTWAAVPTNGIVNANVTLAKMAANSIDSDQYVDGSIDGVHIANDAIDSQHYADGSIDTAHIAADAITNVCLGPGVISVNKMAANSVDSDQYVDGSIDQVHLAVGASKVTNRKGGSATVWSTVGTTNYTPATVRIQVGAIMIPDAGTSITFPVAFSDIPLLFLMTAAGEGMNQHVWISTLAADTAAVGSYDETIPGTAVNCYWLAIGPE
jgi:hypothetical protein